MKRATEPELNTHTSQVNLVLTGKYKELKHAKNSKGRRRGPRVCKRSWLNFAFLISFFLPVPFFPLLHLVHPCEAGKVCRGRIMASAIGAALLLPLPLLPVAFSPFIFLFSHCTHTYTRLDNEVSVCTRYFGIESTFTATQSVSWAQVEITLHHCESTGMSMRRALNIHTQHPHAYTLTVTWRSFLECE